MLRKNGVSAETVVAPRFPVEGTNVSLVLVTFCGRFPVLVVTHVGYIVAAVVVSSVIAVLVVLVELVAVPTVNPDAVPVMLVPTNAVGVPKAGVTKVGDVALTKTPVPVPVYSAEVE